MSNKFRFLLPPGAIHAERAQEQAGGEQILSLDTDMVRKPKMPIPVRHICCRDLRGRTPSISGRTTGLRNKSVRS